MVALRPALSARIVAFGWLDENVGLRTTLPRIEIQVARRPLQSYYCNQMAKQSVTIVLS